MCLFYSKFLNGTNKTEIIDVLKHLDHLIKVGGEDVAAIGSDFDGMECDLFIKNAEEYLNIIKKLSMTDKTTSMRRKRPFVHRNDLLNDNLLLDKSKSVILLALLNEGILSLERKWRKPT